MAAYSKVDLGEDTELSIRGLSAQSPGCVWPAYSPPLDIYTQRTMEHGNLPLGCRCSGLWKFQGRTLGNAGFNITSQVRSLERGKEKKGRHITGQQRDSWCSQPASCPGDPLRSIAQRDGQGTTPCTPRRKDRILNRAVFPTLRKKGGRQLTMPKCKEEWRL